MSELISVIVPVYNGELSIKRCLESIIKQTYKNLEIIVIDDGSTDATNNICKEMQAKDSRIKVITQKNQGVSVARNTGLGIVTGKYIMFADSDDYLDEHICEKLINEIKENNAEISICNKLFFINGKEVSNVLYKKERFVRTGEEKELFLLDLFTNCYDELMNNVKFLSCGVTAKLFSASLILSNDIQFLKNCHFGEDVLFNLNTFEKAEKIAYIDYDGYNFVVNENSSTHKYKDYWEESYKKFVDEIEAFIYRNEKDERFFEALNMMRVTRISGLMTSYYFHKDNHKDFKTRYKEFKNLINNEKYKQSIKKVKFKLLTKRQKIVAILLKLHFEFILALLCEKGK